MNKEELSKELLKCLNLEPDYKISNGPGAIVFKKEFENHTRTILFSYNVYLGSYYLPAYVTGWMSFNKIENYLEDYYKLYKNNELLETIHFSSSRIEKTSNEEISNFEDLTKVKDSLFNQVHNEVIPFFEANNNLQTIFEKVESFNGDFSKINSYLFPPQPIRRIILKYLFQSEDRIRFGDDLVESFKLAESGIHKKLYKKINNYLPDLVNELKLKYG